MESDKRESFELPLEWVVPEDVISRYANNIVVQHSNSEFVISFFETRSPILLGTRENIELTLESLDSVKSICVGRIIVSPEKMGDFIEALQSNWNKYLSEKEEWDSTEEDEESVFTDVETPEETEEE